LINSIWSRKKFDDYT